MTRSVTVQGILLTLLVWLSTAAIVVGFARIDRDLVKRGPLQYLHDGTPGAWTVSQARLVGGSGSDTGRAIARAVDGTIYLLARADANLFDIGAPRGDMDVFVIRLDAISGEVLGSTSVGGSGHDDGVAIAIEADGDVLIAGTTNSADFPAVRLGDGAAVNGVTNSFVVRLNPELTAVRRNILLAGDGHVVVRDMLIDPGGSVYLTGSTSATNFPATRGAYRQELAVRADPMEVDYGADGFLLALDESLLNVRVATLFGGERDDYPYVLRQAANGSLVVAGNSASPDYPVTIRAEIPGGQEPQRSSVFVSVFNRGLSLLQASVYWGSDTSDFLRGMDIGPGGQVHLCGHTNSGFFPLTADAAASAHAGGHYDMFYAVMSAELSRVDYASYVGGANNDFCHGLEVLDSGEVLVTGETNSVELLGNPAAYPGTGVRGSFLARVSQGTTDTVAALKAVGATIVYDTLSAGDDLWLAGYTAASAGQQFARESVPTRPGGRDILYMQISRPRALAQDGAGP